jgi:VIT1/CCC1 family predicted Fe2+/Mn2+ transporter
MSEGALDIILIGSVITICGGDNGSVTTRGTGKSGAREEETSTDNTVIGTVEATGGVDESGKAVGALLLEVAVVWEQEVESKLSNRAVSLSILSSKAANAFLLVSSHSYSAWRHAVHRRSYSDCCRWYSASCQARSLSLIFGFLPIIPFLITHCPYNTIVVTIVVLIRRTCQRVA